MDKTATATARTTPRPRRSLFAFVVAALLGAPAIEAGSPVPTYTKAFLPATIGPGSTATLRFDIVDNGAGPFSNIGFTDNLPADVVLATPALALTDCAEAVLSADDGGTTVSLTGARLGADDSCSITVQVASSGTGTHTNNSGDLNWDFGTSPGATADLTVDAGRPGFSKSFTPASIPSGGTSVLTLVFDNTADGAADQSTLSFTDPLPTGMVVANPSNAATDCGHPSLPPPTLTAVPGTAVVSLFANGILPSFPALAAGASCSVTVDVTTTTSGRFVNVSDEATASGLSVGFATAVLEVPVDYLSKVFLGQPVPPGGTVTLEFTVTNLDRDLTANEIGFSDDLGATLSGLEATGLPPADPCGAGSMLSGTSLLTLTGGSLAPGASCTFSVTLQVPASATPETYPNTTSTVTSDIWTGNAATYDLVVKAVPTFAKDFLVDPVAAGGTTTLEFTITNTSTTSPATDIAFIDELTTFLPFPVSVTLPADGFCGPGASMALVSLGAERQALSMTGGSLAQSGTTGDSCAFTVGVDIPATMPAGVYVNTTDTLTATVGEEAVSSAGATDTLTIVAAPSLTKEFTDDPVPPGGTVTLEFTLTHDAFATADATAVTFTDDLAATLPGLAATGLPAPDLCGPGNGTLSGSPTDTLLTFSGATLTPGEICTFQVNLQVPGGAAAGTYANTTSNVTATVAGISAQGNPGEDDLLVTGFLVTKEFTDDPALPGGTVTLRFTLDNSTGAVTANNVAFSDNLAAALAGLTAPAPLPEAPCGGTLSALSGDTLLSFTGGSVAAEATCSFDVTLQVPPDADTGAYPNVTSVVSAELPGLPAVNLPPATDVLTVDGSPLLLSKTFTDDPGVGGGTVTLEFTLTNSFSLAASAIAFTDDLDATLSGLVATGLPAPACGGSLSGTSPIMLSGASLGAGASCTFSATLSIPAAAPAGTYLNTTSPVTGTIDAVAVAGDPASDGLRIQSLTFAKAFDGFTMAGGSPVLTFTIDNQDAGSGVSNLFFGDDLEAVLPGLVATGLPVSDVCGAGSELSGTSFLALTGGNLGPLGSCVIPVTLEVPAAAAAGIYPNVTTNLFVDGLAVAAPATADLVVGLIFTDGFESGDLSAWSGSSP